MTKEEVKQLKPGDDIFIRAKYQKVLEDGDVSFTHSATTLRDKVIKIEGFTHPENIISSLPSPDNVIKNTETAPKYDPCRPFKEGDEVRVVENKGRKQKCSGSLATVKKDEEENKVLITIAGSGIWWIDAAYLELVTPVEELEPFFVMELKGAYGVYNTRFQPETEACHFFTDMHPHAKEAAEAECARLNKEYRKKQNNG